MYTWFIARRLFSSSDGSRRVSQPTMRIATLGVAVGVAIMLVSVSVVLGFQREIRQKIMGLGAHVQVMNYESLVTPEWLPIVIDDEIRSELDSIPHVSHVQRFCTKIGMLKTDDAFQGAMFRGVGQEYDTTFLQSNLIKGRLPRFSDQKASGEILISSNVAHELKLDLEDNVFAYFFEKSVRVRKFRVVGIFCTNIADFDDKLVFTDLKTIHSLLKWDTNQMSGAELLLDDYENTPQVVPQIIDKIHQRQDAYGATYTFMTIKEMYPQIFSWLALLDLDVVVILVLMICVAGFTMISGLLIIILERTNFIGVMKALGAPNREMRHLFLYFAVFIILRGMLIGNGLAFVLILIQKHTGLIHLDPAVYYVDSVPLVVDWVYVLLINLLTLFACVLALIVPSYLVSNIHPARSIRFE